MVVVFDNNTLCLLLHPEAKGVPNDPQTGKRVDRAQDRMSYLVEQIRQAGNRILIPAPVLSGFLTFASPEYLVDINKSAHFEVAPFDQRAAIEAAATLKRHIRGGRGKKLGLVEDWQIIKVDRQVVAIAKVNGAETIYSTDGVLLALAEDSGLEGIHVAELPLPPSNTPLLDAAEETPTDSAFSSTEPPLPAEQSPGGEPLKVVAPAPALPSALPAAPKPQPPGSSPPGPLLLPSKQ